MAVKEDLSGAVRQYAARHFVREARRTGNRRFVITAGEVHRALGFHNRVPVVCNALRSDKFLRDNGLKLVQTSGPPSGLSTTAAYTYEFADGSTQPAEEAVSIFDAAYGCAKEVYAQFGGGEVYLRDLRASWDDKEPYNRFNEQPKK